MGKERGLRELTAPKRGVELWSGVAALIGGVWGLWSNQDGGETDSGADKTISGFRKNQSGISTALRCVGDADAG